MTMNLFNLLDGLIKTQFYLDVESDRRHKLTVRKSSLQISGTNLTVGNFFFWPPLKMMQKNLKVWQVAQYLVMS